MSDVYYAAWYSGLRPAVFRLHYDPKTRLVTLAERWGDDGWEPVEWDQIRGWVDPIAPGDLPSGVTL